MRWHSIYPEKYQHGYERLLQPKFSWSMDFSSCINCKTYEDGGVYLIFECDDKYDVVEGVY